MWHLIAIGHMSPSTLRVRAPRSRLAQPRVLLSKTLWPSMEGPLGSLTPCKRTGWTRVEAQQRSEALSWGWEDTHGSLGLGAKGHRGPSSPSPAAVRCRSPGTHHLCLSLLLNLSCPGKAFSTPPPIPFPCLHFAPAGNGKSAKAGAETQPGEGRAGERHFFPQRAATRNSTRVKLLPTE